MTNIWSDWSTQTWKDNKLALRVHKIQDDYVVRIVHLQKYVVYISFLTSFLALEKGECAWGS